MSNPSEPLRPHENKARTFLWLLIVPLILVPTGGNTFPPAHRARASAQPAHLAESYGKLPLAFEANQGQSDAQVKFLSRGAGYSLFLTNREAVLTLGKASRQEPDSRSAKSVTPKNRPAQQEKPSVLHMKLLGANAMAEVAGQDKLPGKSNYFLGNGPKKWHTDIPQYAKVRCANIYPGVDLVYYGNQRELEYDFVVQPGADPSVIRLGIEGARHLRLEQGDLVLTSAAGEVSLRRPHIYQEVTGATHDIGGGYVLNGKNEAGFRISNYDPNRPLIIDPILAYSTYLGGWPEDYGYGIAVDAAGNAYVTGSTYSADFPTVNAIQPTGHGGSDAFVTKFNASGTALVYSTFLGGSGYDSGNGIAVDAAGNAYLTGWTFSTDFPTVNAIQPTNQGLADAFVTKINASGSALVYSTYLGGSAYDSGSGIAVDTAGNAYVTGWKSSTIFPRENFNAEAFVTKIAASGTALVYSRDLGGSRTNVGSGIAVDSAGNAYVTGYTNSTDFPTVNAIQTTNQGRADAFATKINASGSALVYSTYLGGSVNDAGDGIAVDSAGNAYVTGYTNSTDFPTVNAIQTTNQGLADAFVTKINASGTALVYSTYLGGTGTDIAYGIAVDSAGHAYVTGYTNSTDFPNVNAFQLRHPGQGNAFITGVNASGSTLVYSGYLGGGLQDQARGIAVDSAGSVYVTGFTKSANFLHTALALQQSLKGFTSAFVTKIAPQTFVSVSPTKIAFAKFMIGHTSAPRQLTVTNQGSGNLTINNIFIGGADASDFAQTNTCPPTLSAGSFCTVSVTFTPGGEDERQGRLGIVDSDPASPQAILLSGTGTVVSLSATKVNFGKQVVGTSSVPQSVTLANVGSVPLNFSGLSITGGATQYLQTNTCGISIAAGATCTITVTFTPTATGFSQAAVSIIDDGGGSPQKIALTGTGI